MRPYPAGSAAAPARRGGGCARACIGWNCRGRWTGATRQVDRESAPAASAPAGPEHTGSQPRSRAAIAHANRGPQPPHAANAGRSAAGRRIPQHLHAITVARCSPRQRCCTGLHQPTFCWPSDSDHRIQMQDARDRAAVCRASPAGRVRARYGRHREGAEQEEQHHPAGARAPRTHPTASPCCCNGRPARRGGRAKCSRRRICRRDLWLRAGEVFRSRRLTGVDLFIVALSR